MKPLCVLYARTSTDEEDGQDVKAQIDQGRSDADAAGLTVVGVFVDEGVSGSVPPMDRKDWPRAVEAAQACGAVIATRDWSRFARMHPAHAMAALDICPVRVRVLRDTPLEVQSFENQGPADAGMMFFMFFGPWQYRVAAVQNGRNTWEAFSKGGKPTKSGLAPHRPIKLSEDVARAAWAEMQDDGSLSLRTMAHTLSERRGAFRPGLEAKGRRDAMVSHKALSAAFERYGLGKKSDRDERVTAQGSAAPGSKGGLSPTAGRSERDGRTERSQEQPAGTASAVADVAEGVADRA